MRVFEAYLEFIKKHESQTFKYNHHQIAYRFFGKGEQVILVLMGSSMFPTEAYYKILNPLSEDYKMLTIEYPHHIQTLKELIDVLILLLKKLDIAKVNILGASHGGSLAQAFAVAYPPYIESIILYNTLTITTHMSPSSIQVVNDVIGVVKELEELRGVMPLESVKGVFLEQVEAVIEDASEIDLFEHMISAYSEEDERLQMRLIMDFLKNYAFSPEQFAYLKERVLILYGHDDDPFGGAEQIETLVELFDSPKLEFIKSDRFSLILDAKELIEKVKRFLNEKPLS